MPTIEGGEVIRGIAACAIGLALAGAPVALAANAPSPDAAPANPAPDPAPASAPSPTPQTVVRVQRPVAQQQQQSTTTTPAKAPAVTLVRHSQPARHPHHKRAHRAPAPTIHRVAAPDVMVPVATQHAATSSRDTLLGIAGALLLAFAAAGAAVTMREVRT